MMVGHRDDAAVLGIDPGEDCGWSIGAGIILSDNNGFMDHNAFKPWLSRCLVSGCVERVVIERFDPRRWDNDTLLTIKVVGVVEWLCQQAGIPLASVNPSDKKKILATYIMDGIKSGHARDAEAVRLWDLQYGTW